MKATSVLIVGAGPTGLVLALNFARRGVPFRLIDEADGPGQHSRAMVVQARTLEFYRQFGFAQEMIDDGIAIQHVALREADRSGRLHDIVAIDLADFGAGISPYPFALAYPQDDHERFLVAQLAKAGATVEWRTKCETFAQQDDGVIATMTSARGTEQIRAEYLCGCDGAHSKVRETLGLTFSGKTYEQLFFVCDVRVASGFDRGLRATLGEDTLLLIFPVRSTGMQRLIGLVPRGLSETDGVSFDSIRNRVEPLLNVQVSEVNWFATYRVHHRIAERFRAGRVCILGDAAHIHSPAGGQGMNTGIGDAMNLGWKLADIIQGRATDRILETFDSERAAFARTLVATTDRGFTAVVARGLVGDVVRRVLAPTLIAVATHLRSVRRAFFATVSQTAIHYYHSSLSEGVGGKVRGGDRLPWIGDVDNFAPLQSVDWQVHAFATSSTNVSEAAAALGIPMHVFPWTDGARRAGFARDGSYLVRPDGYVALAMKGDDVSRLESYVQRVRWGDAAVSP